MHGQGRADSGVGGHVCGSVCALVGHGIYAKLCGSRVCGTLHSTLARKSYIIIIIMEIEWAQRLAQITQTIHEYNDVINNRNPGSFDSGS